MRLAAYTDGASRGNPGPAAIGVVLLDEQGHVLERISEYLGSTTNNQAEYRALILALQISIKYKPDHLDLFTDSELMARQLTGLYRVKNAQLMPLHQQAKELLRDFPSFGIHNVPRGFNRQADALANKALDERHGV